MSDNGIPGVYRITPTLPVKPPQPAHKERDDQQRKKAPEKQKRVETDDGEDDKPTIDEYV
ncbi:MAG: hypothetical protein HKN35_14105 [Woeseia sp.]|nr:hypothetical protein [Woeseia sp.]MBT8096509.1 hypothetical protein [Woeseia sp.]NNE62023.1 hypothetical protein [Woeseia sp.]NNL54996.1 hypothetical protein [Woeseia sp.]